MSLEELQQAYGPEYYNAGLGPIPYERSEVWLNFFSSIADQVVRSLHPHRVLDAGCAMGFLVEAFWDRGVYCEGIDISEYAISKVRRDIKDYCSVGSLTDPILGRFDLITCIEVLEHLRPDEVRSAVANLCAAADVVLFSSTPSDFEEPTHHNVRPPIFWLQLFSEFDFWPDARFDASFLTMHAMLLRKGRSSDHLLPLFSEYLRHKVTIGIQSKEITDLRAQLGVLRSQSDALAGLLQSKEAELLVACGERDQLVREFSSARENLASLRKQLSYRDSELRRVRAATDKLNMKVDSLEGELARIGQLMQAKNSEYQDLTTKLAEEVSGRRREHNRFANEVKRVANEREQIQATLNAVLSSRTWRWAERLRRNWPHAYRVVPFVFRKFLRDGTSGQAIGPEHTPNAANSEPGDSRERPSPDHQVQKWADLIRTSPLFDPNWYCATYPDVAESPVDPAVHYIRYGGVEGRNPGPDFDSAWYLRVYSDVAADGINPLVHYLLFGEAEGRAIQSVRSDRQEDDSQGWVELVRASSLFDANWYLETYPDVAQAQIDPALHYVKYGGAEGRNPGPLFDTAWYLNTHSDVAQSGLNPLVHYLLFGALENREIRACNSDHAADPAQDLASAQTASVTAEIPEIKKFALFISGCPGDAFRYRVEYQVEQLQLLGLTTDTALFDEVDYTSVLSKYAAFILHRVPHTPGIEAFILAVKELGKPVIFDTDDLVFNESLVNQIKAIRDFSESEYELYIDGVRRYHHTLSLCTSAIVTTEHLRDSVLELFPELPVYINRNAVGREMIELANTALQQTRPDDGCVRIAYFSGTRTHQDDFEQCVPALAQLLERYQSVRLMIVGHLDVPAALAKFEGQTEIFPLVPWQSLPTLFRRVDINLAPLELGNRFTAAKSELKYFEAALMGVPTVASDVESYRIAISSGENGFLCRDENEWYDVLERLTWNRELRLRIGANARREVLAHYTTRARAPQFASLLRDLFNSHGLLQRSHLAIAFILRAPIAQTGGGYKTIFSIAHEMAYRGHDVHLYLEPIAHLAEKTTEEITAFCRQYFGEGPAVIHVGHERIHPSDIAIATNWPTAYVLHRLTNTECKAYFIQDYEPDFYDCDDPNYLEAERTYDLPSRKIVIGKYLSSVFSERDGLRPGQIPFALDRGVYRNLGIRPTSPPVRILFFARPGLKRRAYPVGVDALRRIAKTYSGVEIAFYGMAEPEDLGFHYKNLGELSRSEVVQEMNRSHIHLSFSLTNISWVPFEAMACGCAVVEAKVPSVELWMERGACVLTDPTPDAVSSALARLIRDEEFRKAIASAGERYVNTISSNWPDTCSQFEAFLLESVY